MDIMFIYVFTCLAHPNSTQISIYHKLITTCFWCQQN
uniref:(California timema) hypothetical protein n=1 Tax=Timema californicum TaxID=61474 RepID=A0A7R9JM18_TIMCA|nr:unnamed protein product [Timema californicum]